MQEAFIAAKNNSDKLTGFNVSVGITTSSWSISRPDVLSRCAMKAVSIKVDPVALWDMIMRSTWDWAEPGVLFIDRINEMNNLHYCETIEATNPCGERTCTVWRVCLVASTL